MRRKGKFPGLASVEKFTELEAKPSSELASLRADLGSLMHVHGAMVNRYRLEAEAITSILHRRDRPELEVSDHAIVRWLEKVKGQDMDALRREIATAALAAKQDGGMNCRAKGDAVAYSKDNVTFIVAHRNNVVTVVFGEYANPIDRR